MENAKKIVFVPPNIKETTEFQIRPEEFKFFRDLIEEKCGITLSDQKVTLVQSRLAKRLRDLNFKNYSEYATYLKNGAGPDEIINFVNMLTTNKTDFFREEKHFEYLKDHIINKMQNKRIFLWSAACSTGAEPYSLAILFEEIKEQCPAFDYRILGTDIDTQVLEKAETGIYSNTEIIQLPSIYKQKYMHTGKGQNHGLYKVNNQLRSKIKFRKHNLIEEAQKYPLKFDFIFLRNVMIYFSKETIQKVIDKMRHHLNKDGLLFIGHSESINNINHDLKSIGMSIYLKEK